MYDAGALVFNIRAAGVQVFEDQVRKADQAVGGLGKSTQETASKTEDLGKKQDRTTEQTKKQREETQRQKKAQEDAARAAKEYTDAQERVGRVLVTAGAAIVATTALTVNSAIQWESAWAGVTKTVDGTAEELAEVEGGLRGLTDVLPAAHSEIAAVAEAAGQLGVETPNVVAFTRTMIDLGETTNLSANDAATALARFMNVMGTAQGEVSNLGSTVVELGNNYATTEAEIVNMAQRLSGAARQVGLTEGETLGLAAALSSVGIEAEAGGTAVSKVMINIAAAVDEGGEDLTAFSAVAGSTAEEFAAKWRTDPGAAMALFVSGLADAEAQGQSTFAVIESLGITEQRMRDALLRAAAASEQFTTAMGTGNEAYAENNALQEEAAKRYETVEAQLGIMRNRINDAAIDLGSVFLPVVADAAGAVGDFADGVASLPAPLQEAVVVGGLMIGMVALLGGTAMIAVPKVVTLWGQITALTAANTLMGASLRGTAAFLTGPWGIAFVAAAAGAMLLQKHVEGLKTSTEEWQNVIRNAKSVDDLFDATKSDVAIFSRLDEAITDAETFRSKLDIIANNDFLRGLDGAAGSLKQSLQDMGKELGKTAETDLPSAQNAFRMLGEQFDLNDEQLMWLLDTQEEYKQALYGVADAQGVNVTTGTEAENATNLLKLAMGEGEGQSKSAAAAYIEAADGAESLRKDLDQLLDVLNEANGVGQDAISANIDYQNTLRDVDEQIRKAQEGAEGYALGLDTTTQAGADNKAMLVDLAKDAWDAAKAQHALDGDTNAYRQTLEDSRAALIERIEDFGVSGQAAQDLADDILNIPSETEWKMIAETADADAKLTALKAKLDAIPNVTYKRVQLDSFTVGNFDVSIPNADGNVFESYANGGVRENHVAQMARAGAWRVWAEPETGGESYIPHAASKRGRSEQLMAETAQILGGTYIPSGSRGFADGGSTASGSGSRVVALLERIAAELGRPNLSIVNPVSKDATTDAWEAAQMVGIDV